MTAIDPIAPGPRLVPYIAVDDATAALRFYADVLGMRECSRIAMADGRIGHTELEIGNVRLYLSDEFPEIGVLSQKTGVEHRLVCCCTSATSTWLFAPCWPQEARSEAK
ncbi:MAG: VOC family protein [Nannocystaceae bacterium]|nr:VOC family protein [Nannocystaceae bacterium]